MASKEERRQRNEFRRELIKLFPRERESLLAALHFIEDKFGYLPDWAMEVLGWHLGKPASEIYGAATSYSELHLFPGDENDVSICTGLSCSENGALEIRELINSSYELKYNLKEVPCAFMCAVGPVIKRNGRWIGKLNSSNIKENLNDEAA
jgi:NADH:ubiquinone oxidoreductase subunit E